MYLFIKTVCNTFFMSYTYTITNYEYFQIAKNRYSGDLGVMPLDFDKDSLSFSQKQQNKVLSSEEIS